MATKLYKLDGRSGFSRTENAEFIANALVSRETKLHAEPPKGSDTSGRSLSGTRWGAKLGQTRTAIQSVQGQTPQVSLHSSVK